MLQKEPKLHLVQRSSVPAKYAGTATIRQLREQDLPRFLTLCKAHAAFEHCSFESKGKMARWSTYLLEPDTGISCWVVQLGHELVGYATFMKQFSTWDATCYLYLDCLYLEEACRGQGVGKQLMQKIKHFALDNECVEIQWQTPSFNEKAIGFYQSLGAKSKTKERFFWDLE